MIRRSTLLFFTCLTTFTFSLERTRGVAADLSQNSVVAQAASPVNPSEATDTGSSVPNVLNPKPASNASAVSAGSQGDSVKIIQERLQDRGYYSGPIDGVYGANTQSAVEAFQQDAGFQTTGQVDMPTWQRLRAPDLLSNSDGSSTTSAGTEQTEVPETEASETETSETASQNSGTGSIVPDVPSDVDPSNSGVDVAQATTVQDAESQPVADPDAQSTGGVGRVLWPSLALVAALSSFGIGFLLANRDKPSSEDEDAWGQPPSNNRTGDTPIRVSQSVRTPQGRTPQSSNGYNANSIEPTAATTEVHTPLNETVRLSKVNIVSELLSDLQSHDPGKRRKAIWELGQRGDSSAVQPMVNQMTAVDSKEKSLILAALSEIGIRSLKPMNRALAIALQDDNPEVRKNAIRDLTRIYDLVAQISQMLGHATEDEDIEVRQTAHWALEQLNRIRQTPEVRMSLQSLESSAKAPDFLPGEVSN